jgi:hypothetical protein
MREVWRTGSPGKLLRWGPAEHDCPRTATASAQEDVTSVRETVSVSEQVVKAWASARGTVMAVMG